MRLTVYSILGQQVQELAIGSYEAGAHTVEWNGRGATENEVAPGLYLYRLEAGLEVAVGKMLLTK